MRAVILAGGLGTRLRAIVSDRPKPMAQVAGKPFLEYQLDHLRTYGIIDVVLCVGHMAEQIRGYFADGRSRGMRIDYAIERELLGTAGAVRNSANFIDGKFLLLNGDSYLDLDLASFTAAHEK